LASAVGQSTNHSVENASALTVVNTIRTIETHIWCGPLKETEDIGWKI